MRAKDNLRGILAMCAAMALFVINDTFVKLAAESWPPAQIMAIRGTMALAIVVTLNAVTVELANWRFLLNPFVTLRCALEGFIAFTFISALAAMPLADATAILLISPLLITMAAAVLLREDVRWRRWLAVAVGFIGMLLVVRPGAGGFGLAAVLALASAIGVAVRDLMTRRLPESVPNSIVALGGTMSTFVVGGFASLFQPWVPITGLDTTGTPFLYVIGAALTVAAGNVAIVVAFRDVDVSVISPFRYTVILWAIIAGYLVFQDAPNLIGWVGIVLIVASGLYTLYREKKVEER